MGTIYLFLADGFEEIEALATVDVLRRANLSVQTVSIMDTTKVVGAHDIAVLADQHFPTTSFQDVEMLFLPGGTLGATNLYAYQPLQKLILEEAAKETLLVAICAAPLIYGRLGLLKGKAATCYTGYETDLKDAFCKKDASVVEDGNFITANGPGATLELAFLLVERFCGAEKVADVKAKMRLK